VVTPQPRLITATSTRRQRRGAYACRSTSSDCLTGELSQARGLSADLPILLPAEVAPRQHHAAARRAHLTRLQLARVGGTGPLGRKAWPRIPRNPAPLARKPPVLTRHEGRRSR
jgi:hypothetical protein